MAKPSASTIALSAAVPLPASDAPPSHIHLLPAGVIRTIDGRGPYQVRDPQAVIAASFAENDRLPIDENHATDLAAPRGEPAPARGWIVGLEARTDGIWGRVEWTKTGADLVGDKSYRQISPAIAHLKDGTIVGVVRASLVNNANLRGLTALHSEDNMDFLSKLRRALSLKEDADEATALASIETLKASVSTHGAQAAKAVSTAIAPLAKAVGLKEDADGAAVLVALQALSDPAKMVPATAVVALQQQFNDLQTSVARDKATTFIDSMIKLGKVPAPAQLRDHYIARHIADPAAVEKELGAMVSLHGRKGPGPTPPGDKTDGDLSEEEQRAVTLMGLDPKAYAQTKKTLGVQEGAL